MEEETVLKLIGEQLGISASQLHGDTVLSDLGADSLDLFQIISALEDEFDLSFDHEGAESLKTVGDAVAYVTNALEN